MDQTRINSLRDVSILKKKVLHKLADLIEANAMELAVLGVRDNGTEFGMAYKGEPMSASGTFRFYAESVRFGVRHDGFKLIKDSTLDR